MAELIFRETTTIGMRVKLIDRIVMSRTAVKVQTIHGEIAGKRCEYGDILKIYPEYESARAAAKASGRPLVEIYDAFYRAAK